MYIQLLLWVSSASLWWRTYTRPPGLGVSRATLGSTALLVGRFNLEWCLEQGLILHKFDSPHNVERSRRVEDVKLSQVVLDVNTMLA